MDVVYLANRLFPIVNIATNGLSPVPPNIRHTILISLDGSEATHDRIRGPGVFQRVMDNYRGDLRVIYRMPIHKMNLDDIETVVHIAKQNGARGVSFIVHAPHVTSDELTLTHMALYHYAGWQDCSMLTNL